MKYNTLGRNARVPVQYVQPAMKPTKGPKARSLHAYSPPWSGYREERKTTHNDNGRNMVTPPINQTVNELAPVAAAVPSHCRLQPAVTMKSVISSTPSARPGCAGGEVEFIIPRGCYDYSQVGRSAGWPSGSAMGRRIASPAVFCTLADYSTRAG